MFVISYRLIDLFLDVFGDPIWRRNMWARLFNDSNGSAPGHLTCRASFISERKEIICGVSLHRLGCQWLKVLNRFANLHEQFFKGVLAD